MKKFKYITTILFICGNQTLSEDILVNWKTVKNATKYEVTYVSDSGFSLTQTVSATEYTIKNVSEGRKYIITVRALDDKSNSSVTSIPLFVQIDKTNKTVYLKQPETKYKVVPSK